MMFRCSDIDLDSVVSPRSTEPLFIPFDRKKEPEVRFIIIIRITIRK